MLIAVICAGAFAIVLAICYIRLGATMPQAVHSALIFFVGIAIVGFGVLRTLAYLSHRKKSRKNQEKKYMDVMKELENKYEVKRA